MSIVLGDLQLIVRIQDGNLEEIRNVNTISTTNKRNIIEFDIPGRKGEVLQDMGLDSPEITVIGELFGKNARATLEKIVEMYESNKPVDFSSNISSITDISQVLIERFDVEQLEGSSFRYNYLMILNEYIPLK